jgi:hypothetical protein
VTSQIRHHRPELELQNGEEGLFFASALQPLLRRGAIALLASPSFVPNTTSPSSPSPTSAGFEPSPHPFPTGLVVPDPPIPHRPPSSSHVAPEPSSSISVASRTHCPARQQRRHTSQFVKSTLLVRLRARVRAC